MHLKHIILSDLKDYLLKNYGNSIKDVILFGSNAWGGAREDSDYDVLIILDRTYTGKDENRILDLCYEIDLKYNILLDVHLLTENEINSLRGKQSVFANAIKSGIYA